MSLTVWVWEDFFRYSFWLSFSLWLQTFVIWLTYHIMGLYHYYTLHPPPPTQPPPLPISWKRTLGILWSPLSIHSSVCSWCHLFLLCCMNFDQICCKPFPFARLLQPHADFWSWAKDQKVKCVNFCPLLCVLQHCAQDLKGSCCLPSCMLKLYNIQSAFYSDL